MTTPGEHLDAALTAMQKATDRLNTASDRLQAVLDAEPVPTPEPPGDVTTPPDPGKLPVRVARSPVQHTDAYDFIIDRPTRQKDGKTVSAAGAWLDKYPRPAEPVEYRLVNGVIRNYGPLGGSRWDHGIYANNAALFLDDIHIHGPNHREPQGRSHPIYLNGSSLTASRLMIGAPSDEHPHTISINIDKGDGVEHKPRPVTIDTLLVYGGWRNVIEATPGTVSALTIGRMIVVNPVTADGLWEGIEVEGCEVQIGDYTVIDTEGRWTDGLPIKGHRCSGGVDRLRVYAPALSHAAKGELLLNGYGLLGSISQMHNPPATPAPDWTLDNFDALVKHYGGAA